MTTSLYLDDERSPRTDRGWTVVRSVADAIRLMKDQGCPTFITFDHDLGGGQPTGYDLAHWMVERDLDACGNFFREGFTFGVHSANPVGRDNIVGLLSPYLASRGTR